MNLLSHIIFMIKLNKKSECVFRLWPGILLRLLIGVSTNQFVIFTKQIGAMGQELVVSGPPGGIVSELVVIPNKIGTVFAANQIPFTGILKSTNYGSSWEILNNGMEIDLSFRDAAIYSFAVDTQFPDTMYVSIKNSSAARGFYRSFNGGYSWELIIDTIAINAVVAYNGRVYALPSGGGLLASFNGGETWSDIAPTLPSANCIELDNDHLGNLYVGTINKGLYSILHDGLSVEHLGFNGKSIMALDVLSSDSNKIIAIVVESINGDSVFISNDEGISWSSRNIGLPPIDPSNSIESLLISPENINILYVGTSEGVYKTEDQGLNWFASNEGLGIPSIWANRPAPVLILAADPANSDILYAGTDRYGLYRTVNEGQQWSLIGIPAFNVSGLSVSFKNPELVYTGTEDGFYVRRNGKWFPTTLWGGETSGIKSVISSPIDSNIVIATYRNALFYPQIYKSTDGGQTWRLEEMLAEGEVINFVFDPLFPERLYGIYVTSFSNAGKLLISNDSGDNWDTVQLDSTEFGVTHNLVVKPLAINSQNSDELYIVDISGQVFKSTDRAITWKKIKNATDTSHFAIVINPSHPQEIYLGTYGIWKSEDGGETWGKIDLNTWVLDLDFDEKSTNLYAATYGEGILFTEDGGRSWDSLESSCNQFFRVIDIGEDEGYSKIYAGSYGTGVFEWRIATTQVPLNENTSGSTINYPFLQNYPNPFNDRTTIYFEVSEPNQTLLYIVNIQGQIVRTLINEHRLAGRYSFCWEGRNDAGQTVASGIYFCHFKSGIFHKVSKLLLLK